jgi:ferredoxin-type protein NapG
MTPRRAFLKRIGHTALSAGGLSALVLGAHKLMQPHAWRYPQGRQSPNRPGLGKSLGAHQDQQLIRPPGALEEKAFMAGCIRCQRCQDACDVGAIQYFPQSRGKLAHTPYIDPSVKGCNLCLKCTQVCPTGALRPVADQDKPQVKMASISFHQDLCLSFKAKRLRDEQALLMEIGREPTETEAPYERRGPCGECYMFCPLRKRAVNLEPGFFLAPRFDETQCAGCGLCEEVCRAVTQGRPAVRVQGLRDLS